MLRLTRRLLSLPLKSRRIRPIRRTKPLPFQPRFDSLEDRVVPSRPLPFPVIYVGAEFGAPPTVKAYDAETGKLNFERIAYESDFTGGIHVAAADITRDGFPDLIVAPGEGGGPRVRVLDGKTGLQIGGPLGNFWAYSKDFTGGVEVAAADVNGDYVPDIITAAGQGGGPHVRVFDGVTGEVIHNFYAFSPNFTGGVHLAAADFTGDNQAELVVGAGYGGAPHVKIYDFSTETVIPGPLGNFYAFDPDLRSGVNVGTDYYTGDVTGDGRADLLVGGGKDMNPRVKVFDGVTGAVAKDFLAYDKTMKAGVRPVSAFVTDDKYGDIIVGTGKGAETKIRVFDGVTGVQLAGAIGEYLPFGPGSLRGVNVAASNDPAYIGTTLAGFSFTLTPDGLFHATTGNVEGDTAVAPPPDHPSPTGTLTVTIEGLTGVAASMPDIVTVWTVIPVSKWISTTNLNLWVWLAPGKSLVTIRYDGDAVFAVHGQGVTYTVSDGAGGSSAPARSTCPPQGTPLQAVPGGVGNRTAQATAKPVRYWDGMGLIATVDLASSGLGGWGADRTWTSLSSNAAGSHLGNGWSSTHQPQLIITQGGLVELAGDGTPRWFDGAGTPDANGIFSTYTGRFDYLDRITYDSTTDEFVLADGFGTTLRFAGFGNGRQPAHRGALESRTNPGGEVTAVTSRDSTGRPTEVQASETVGGTTTTESYLSTYLASSDPNAGRLASVTLRRKVGAGSWQTVRAVGYEYYVSSDANGTLGDLKRATVTDPAGGILNQWYYRYYTASSLIGYAGGLKYAFGPVTYAKLKAVVGGTDALVDAASDSTVAPYLDNYFEYDSARRVIKEIAAGDGCSSCTGGQGTYTYAYTSGSGTGMNGWAMKTVETLPDETTNTIYTNQYAMVMYKAYSDGTNVWRSYWQYDSAGRVILAAAPSAVTGVNDKYADLVQFSSGNAVHLADSAGLIEKYSYGSSTTATTTTAGNVNGRLQSIAIRRGETGTDVPQSAMTYILRTVGSIDAYFPASATQYRNDNGTGGQTTSLAFTWITGTFQAESITTTLPTVTTAQNGSNSATSIITTFDTYGRPVWSKDQAGFITYSEYDTATGAVTKQITDVDTTQTSTEPSGWTTPSGGGLHLTTTFEVDSLGRTTKTTFPNGRIDYTVYDDDNFEVRYYSGWNTSTNTPTGPTTVYRDDRARGYTETLTMSATPSVSSGRPTGTESIGSLQSLSRSYRNEAGQVVTQDAYHNLSGVTYSTSANIGMLNTNYYRTAIKYSTRGWFEKTTSPLGTISRQLHDGLGRVVSEWVGTDDTPTSGFWSPTNTAGTDLVKVAEYEYDGGGVGDGNLTKQTAIPGGGAANRVTQTYFDWRNRPVAVKAGVEGSESTSTNRPITYTDYDNLNQVTKSRMYDGDAVTITSTNGVPNAPSSSLLRSQSTASYDELGRVYLSETYSVDPGTGTVGSNTLKSNTWFDARGLVIKTSQPGGLVQKMVYDGAGRLTTSYATDGGGDTGYADADDVIGDKVLEQSESAYDASGNVLSQTVRQRNHDTTGTGALGTASTGNKARVSYTAYYYDVGDRITAVANYGTNGASSWTRAGSVPTRSDTILVTSFDYDSAGRQWKVTDPKAIVSWTEYDALGRTTKTIEHYVDGTVGDDNDKTTEYTYNAAGMTTLTAKLTSGYQTTEWIYGVTTGGGSAITSNDVTVETRWPDPSTGAASSGQKDLITINALGQPLTSTDRNGTVHALSYDVLGRLASDAVTTFAAGVLQYIKRIDTAYDGQGNPYLITSYGDTSGTTVRNQVQRTYNGLGQMIAEYQAHSGAVNTGSSPKVQYAYSEMASGANHSRPVSMTYPNGRVIDFNYGVALDDSISRLSALKDGATTLESYDYLGLGTVVKRGHAQSGVDLTYIKASGESNGDAGDQYTGLDRFGRVADQRWRTSSVEKDRYQYAYDRNGNRTSRTNALNSNLNESYTYDSLNQLSGFSTTGTTKSWDYDALGNWDGVTTNGSTQTRTHNKQNEITAISGATTPTFDANGNMTKDETGRVFYYDAWNRLQQVNDPTNSFALVVQVHDGLGRRVTETASTFGIDLYYSADWQVVEERNYNAVTKSYVWSPVYVDAMVARDRDTDANGSLDERLYVMHDANFNVTGLVNTSGTVVERYTYDPYGVATVRDGSWTVTTTAYVWQYRHQGLRFSFQSELYYVRNRDYSPTLGRWVTVDPISYEAGDVNLYRYVGNEVTGSVDPSGLEFGDWWDPRTWLAVQGQMAIDAFNGVKSIATGEAGNALGDRAIEIYEFHNGKKFDGSSEANGKMARIIAGQLLPFDPAAEAIIGADIANGKPLTACERTVKGANVVAQSAGTVLGAAGVAGKCAGIPVPKGHTRVFRAVSEAEYQQIMRTGKFELPDPKLKISAIEGKWFCDTKTGALKFGKSNMGPGSGKAYLIEVDVPDITPGQIRKIDIDHLGHSRYLPMEDLHGIKPRPKGVIK